MKIIAVNGSPRKNWNTDTLLRNVLDGAASAGAETEMVCLYDLNFKGCRSCICREKRRRKSGIGSKQKKGSRRHTQTFMLSSIGGQKNIPQHREHQ